MGQPAPIVEFPAWRGFLTPGRESLPKDLCIQLDAGRPMALLGRASAEGGRKARDQAVRDLFGALDQLATRYGLNLRRVVPEAAILMRRLENQPAETSKTADGKTFRNRYVLLDLREKAPLVILVSTGTGLALDQNGDQPFIRKAGEVVRQYNAACVYCKRLDRLGRQDWGLAPMMTALEQGRAFLGDEDGIRYVDEAVSIGAFLRGGGSKKQAKAMPEQTRREQINRTDTEMVCGQAVYHLNSVPPPGFDTCWLKGRGTSPAERLIFLDTDGCRPDPSQIASGASEVKTIPTDGSDPTPVDQVANVRYVLAHYGKSGWTDERLVKQLAARRFSTPHMRRIHDTSTTINPDPHIGVTPLNTILKNLDVYETGVLRREVGAGFGAVAIVNCFPPSGPWAQPEDFKRIRAKMKRGSELVERSTRLTFAGLKATYDNTPVVMLTHKHGASNYAFALASEYPHKRIAPDDHLTLPERLWRESLLAGLMRAGESPVILAAIGDCDEDDESLEHLRAEYELLRATVDSTQGFLNGLRQRLTQTDDEGTLVIQGALLKQLQDDYNEQAKSLDSSRAHMRELETAIEERVNQLTETAPLSSFLQLVESLRDPTSQQFRRLWLSSVTKIHFRSERFRKQWAHGRRLLWDGVMRFTDADSDSTVLIPFDGEYETGLATRVESELQDAAKQHLQALSEGIPFGDARAPYVRHVRPQLARLLGVGNDHYLFKGCSDPRIVQISTRLLLEPDKPLAESADELGEAEPLVQRVYEMHIASPPLRATWYSDGTASETALYALAAHNEGLVSATDAAKLGESCVDVVYNVAAQLRKSGRLTSRRRGGYVITPCACGSFALAPLGIPEPVGPVCLGCRLDRAGLIWPSDPYDRYITHRRLWDLASAHDNDASNCQ